MSSSRHLTLLSLCAAAVSLAGCGGLKHVVNETLKHAKPAPGIPIVVDAYQVSAPTKPERFLAGAAKMDITPPPGYPTSGDGPAGDLSRGYWTRLNARAFFFQDTSGNTAVMVSCDLFAIPGGL